MNNVQPGKQPSDTGSSAKLLINSLASSIGRLTQMLGDIHEQRLHRRPSRDQWCILEIVVHLGEIETRYRGRLERIVFEDRPHVPAIWPCPFPDPLPQLPKAVSRFERERAKTVAFLSTLTPEAWQRRLHHASLGPSMLLKQVQGLCAHDEEHLSQIGQTLKSLREEQGAS